MKLKNSLKKLCPPHEAMLRHKEVFKKKANPNNKKHVANLEKKLDKERAKIKLSLNQVETLASNNKVFLADNDIQESLVEIIKTAFVEYETKEDYYKY